MGAALKPVRSLIHWIAGLLGLLIALGSPASPSAQAQVVTPPSELATIDSLLATYLPKFSNYESNYLLTKGRYYQALWSHSTAPANLALVAPDLLAFKPTDQLESWQSLWDTLAVIGGKSPCRMRIDVYDGPQGKGYVVTVEAILNGTSWSRSINIGNETWRDRAWQAVVVMP